MKQNAEKILVKGLADGYAGSHIPRTISRGPFQGKESAESYPQLDADYNDQWFFKRTGGGQDIARSGDETTTRVFAGGIVDPMILRKLQVTEEQVLAYHKEKLSSLADTTRLHKSIRPEPDGDWLYRYDVIKEYPDVPLTVGVETIAYKGQDVFVHVFLNVPIA